MPFKAKKIRNSWFGGFKLRFVVFWLQQFVWGEVSQPLEKHFARKPQQNRREFFLCFVVNCE